MRKTIGMLAVVACLVFCSVGVRAANQAIGGNHQFIIGFDLPSFGKAQYNSQGQLTGYRGINIGFGYSLKTYFIPGLKEGKLNFFWSWGSYIFLIPYMEYGADIPFGVTDNGNFWTIGAAAGFIFLFPSARLSLAYHF